MKRMHNFWRRTVEQCAVNFIASDGLKEARELEQQGFVKITFLKREWYQPPLKSLRVEIWDTYLIEPTELGLEQKD